DVVTAAQAFHWFDHAVALPEIARVLRPQGRLGVVWNTRDDREPWVAALSRTIGAETVARGDAEAPIEASGLFGPVEKTSFPWIQRLDAPMLRDLVLSRSYVAIKPREEQERILADVDRLFADHALGAEIELPYVTECYRAELR
ncbi:MAG: class I SAM-dependent methyltransferase, partial [Actinobacteria bacterium]